MFAQVYAMSSQKWAAGTSRCTTPAPYARPNSTPHGIGSFDQAHDHQTRLEIEENFLRQDVDVQRTGAVWA